MKLRVAKKVLRGDAIRARMVGAAETPGQIWLMNEIFRRYRQSTIDAATSRFCKWMNSQCNWSIRNWDKIKPVPIPESVRNRLSEMIAESRAGKSHATQQEESGE